MGYSLLQLSAEEEIEVRSCLAAIEIEERREEIERKEKELQEGLEGYFRDSGFDQNTVRESGKR